MTAAPDRPDVTLLALYDRALPQVYGYLMGRCGDRAAMMPKRRRTRAQNRAHRVAAERRQNRDARIARREAREAFYTDLLNPGLGDGEPPPF